MGLNCLIINDWRARETGPRNKRFNESKAQRREIAASFPKSCPRSVFFSPREQLSEDRGEKKTGGPRRGYFFNEQLLKKEKR